MLIPINFPRLEGYTVAPITRGDRSSVQQLYERCADYLELVAGRGPEPNEADNLFRTLPPGKNLDDKMLLGIFTGQPERLVGLLEAIQAYPQADEWYLGVLLLDPAERGHGLDTSIYQALEQWLREIEVPTIWLSVSEANQPAYDFWQHQGFEEVERTEPEQLGEKVNRKIVMRHRLT